MRTVRVGVAATQEVTPTPFAPGAADVGDSQRRFDEKIRGGPMLGIYSCGPGVYVRDGVVRTKAKGAGAETSAALAAARAEQLLRLETPRVSLNAWGPGAPLTRRQCN